MKRLLSFIWIIAIGSIVSTQVSEYINSHFGLETPWPASLVRITLFIICLITTIKASKIINEPNPNLITIQHVPNEFIDKIVFYEVVSVWSDGWMIVKCRTNTDDTSFEKYLWFHDSPWIGTKGKAIIRSSGDADFFRQFSYRLEPLEEASTSI